MSEISFQADPCAPAFSDKNYHLNLHIASIFIIMFFASMGTLVPIVFKKYFTTSSLVFQSAKLFGAGVIMSTAWIHMQTSAVENLTNPCLPVQVTTYSALAGVGALFGILAAHLVQVVATLILSDIVIEEEHQHRESISSHQHNHDEDILQEHNHAGHWHSHLVTHPSQVLTVSPVQESIAEQDNFPVTDVQVLVVGQSSIYDDSCGTGHKHEPVVDSGHDHSHGGVITHSNEISAYLLELGIASHSILVGLALGTARTEFESLLIALVFHQFFEGIALSSVVTEADFKRKRVATFMVVFYSLTTPIGIAIGIAIHESYDGNATSLLITQGILDAVAAGILIYDGLVNIILPHFNGKNFRHCARWKRTVHFIFLWMGAALMSIIGIWA